MKIKSVIGFLMVYSLLLLLSSTVLASPCPCADCPPCYESTGQPDCDCIYVGCDPTCDANECYDCNDNSCECEYRCDPNLCEECVDGSCQVCGGDPNQFCCDGNCCDTDECEECVDGNCVVIDVNSVTPDVNYVCVGCDVMFTVETDPCGYGGDVEWSAPGGDPNSGTGSSFTTSWDTAGIHTATASLCDSNDSNDVTVVAVASLEPNDPNEIYTEFDDEDGDPNTRSFAVCIVDANHEPNKVTVVATPDPDVNEPNLPDCWTLTGGTGTGKLLRTVDRTTTGVTTITCECNTSSKTTKIYVVGVDKVVEEGTTDEGPIYVCLNDTVDLEAIPYPSATYCCPTDLVWEIVEQPAEANAVLDPNSGSLTTTLSGLTKQGDYVVKAKCGGFDTGDTITVKTPDPTGYWVNIAPGFSCSAWWDPFCLFDHETDPWTDQCGNTIKISCYSSACYYEYWYNGTEVGRCPWADAGNLFSYKITLDDRLFLETWHTSGNQENSSSGQGCDGYYCWRTERYNCVDEAPIEQGVWWERDTFPVFRFGKPYPGDNETCPGPSGGGPHPFWPD